MKKIQVLNKIQSVMSIPYSTRSKIVLPILNKLITEGIDEKQVEDLIKEHREEEKDINIEFGEV
jgi:hypothetical protein